MQRLKIKNSNANIFIKISPLLKDKGEILLNQTLKGFLNKNFKVSIK